MEELGGEAFVGTPQLRAHAHGFFMDARLYKRLRAAAAPYAYDDYKKQKVAKKLAEKQESRIRRAEALPAVNAELARDYFRHRRRTSRASAGKRSRSRVCLFLRKRIRSATTGLGRCSLIHRFKWTSLPRSTN